MMVLAPGAALLPELVLLRSADEPPRECIGIHVSPYHIATKVSCVFANGPLLIARYPTVNNTDIGAFDFTFSLAFNESVPLRGLFQQTTRPMDDNAVMIVTLANPRKVSKDYTTLNEPPPAPSRQALNGDDLLVAIDPTTRKVTVIRRVVYVDPTLCKRDGGGNLVNACVIPTVIDPTSRQGVILPTGTPQWLLILREKREKPWITARFVGVVDDSTPSIYRGVWWLAETLKTRLYKAEQSRSDSAVAGLDSDNAIGTVHPAT